MKASLQGDHRRWTAPGAARLLRTQPGWILVASLLFAGFPGPTPARSWYAPAAEPAWDFCVDAVHGSDLNPGTTPTNAFRTLARLL